MKAQKILVLALVASMTLVAAIPQVAAAAELAFPSLWVVDDVAKMTYNITLDGELNTSFGTPNTAISSIAVDPVDGTLWGVNGGGASSPGKLVNYSRSGVVLGEITADTFGSSSGEGLAVASDGNSLWVVDDSATPTVYNVARDGTLLASFATSVFSSAATSPQAIAYDPSGGGSLWITDNAADMVFNVSTSGVLLGSFPSPSGETNLQGITVESDSILWLTGRTTGMLYRVDKTGTSVSQAFPASVFDPSASNPTGIAFDTSTTTTSSRRALTIIRDQIAATIQDLSGSAAAKAKRAVKDLDNALGDSRWNSDGSPRLGPGKVVFDKMGKAVGRLLEIGDPPASITISIVELAELAGEMAQPLIDEAAAAGGDPDLIAAANAHMAAALERFAADEFDNAVDEYRSAWQNAKDALVLLDTLSAGSLWVVDDVAKLTYNITLEGALNTSFATPNTAISSIAVDPVDGTLWGVNEGGSTNPGKLVNYSRTGVVIQEISSAAFGAFGGEGLAVASDGSSLWVVDDPDSTGLVPTVYNVARDGTLLASFATSVFSSAANSPQAIAFDPDSDSLWITDNSAETVFNVSTSGVLLGSFPTDAGPFVTATHPDGVTNVQGITVESDSILWLTDRTNGWLYRITKTGTRITHSFPVSDFDAAASNPTGIAFDTSTPAP